MDLSGLYRRGSGSYEVKEIAPPSQSGERLTNGNFNTGDFTGWSTTTPTFTVNSLNQCVNDGTVSGVFIAQAVTLTVGKTYLIELDVIYLEASVRILYGGDTYLTTIGRHSFTVVASSASFIVRDSGGNAFIVDNISVQEVPEGYPLMDKGDTYLENTVAGTVAFPSKQAYGEWEFSIDKGNAGGGVLIKWIAQEPTIGAIGYGFYYAGTELLQLYRSDPATVNIMATATSAIGETGWYRFKITRGLDGNITFYVKGQEFGNDDWTFVNIGLNPAIDNTYTTGGYFVIDLDLSGKIANIITRKAVQQ